MSASVLTHDSFTVHAMSFRIAFGVVSLLAATACTPHRTQNAPKLVAGSAEQQALRAEILHADSLMFAAYNAHDAERLGTYFAKDLEFYHDAGGLLNWTQAMAGLSGNFDKDNGIRRDLLGAPEVYPIREFGAVEVGTHRFCHRENGAELCGTFKFVHVWRKSALGWQVARAVSYDH